MLVIISLLSLSFFILLSLVSLNYSIFLWENAKIQELSNRVKPKSGSILDKTPVNREFTSIDMGGSVGMSGNYHRSLVPVDREHSATLMDKTKYILNEFRKNFFLQSKRTVKYLISLTKPVEEIEQEQQSNLQNEQKKADIENTINKIVAKNQKNKVTNELVPLVSGNKKAIAKITIQQEDEEESSANPLLATLDLAADREEKDKQDMNLFEKMENKILTNLKQAEMEDYGLWLELGLLYKKFNQPKKAEQIFALVLKHSKGKEKGMARDELIALV